MKKILLIISLICFIVATVATVEAFGQEKTKNQVNSESVIQQQNADGESPEAVDPPNWTLKKTKDQVNPESVIQQQNADADADGKTPEAVDPPNWTLLQLIAYALIAIIWIIIRIIPSWGNNDVLNWIYELLNLIVPNRIRKTARNGKTWVELAGNTKLTKGINQIIRERKNIID